jgi:hypothetical protein
MAAMADSGGGHGSIAETVAALRRIELRLAAVVMTRSGFAEKEQAPT